MRAILFDLDGTLLDIDIVSFIDTYFQALSGLLAEIFTTEQVDNVILAIGEATESMMLPHPGRTNESVFYERFEETTGMDLREHEAALKDFYEERFGQLGADLGPMPGAIEAVAAAREAGLLVAVATNPIFPARAIEHRLAWAGLDASDMDLVTSFEMMQACKPHPDYFRQTAELLGVGPMDCLMVGDDPILDMTAADVGMATYFVGDDTATRSTYQGSLSELPALLQRIEA